MSKIYDQMMARIRAMPNRDINDKLFGSVSRQQSGGRDWLEHMEAFASSGSNDMQALEQAAALVFITLHRTPGVSVDFTVNVLDFRSNLIDHLEARGAASENADILIEVLRAKAFEALPGSSALGDSADISLLLDTYRRNAYLRTEGLSAKLVDGDGVPKAVFSNSDSPFAGSNVTSLADFRRTKEDTSDTSYYMADSMLALAVKIEHEAFNPRDLRDIESLRASINLAVELFADTSKPAIGERMHQARGSLETKMARRPGLSVVGP